MTASHRTRNSKLQALTSRRYVRDMLGPVYGDELHTKRIDSLANRAAGVLRSARLSIHAIGAAYADVRNPLQRLLVDGQVATPVPLRARQGVRPDGTTECLHQLGLQ